MTRLAAGLLVVFALVAPAAQAGDLAYDASEALVVIGHAADGYATQRCIGAGVCTEVNPFLARFESPTVFAVTKTGIASLQLYLTRRLRDAGHPRWALVINVGIGSSFIALGVRNERLAGRVRQ